MPDNCINSFFKGERLLKIQKLCLYKIYKFTDRCSKVAVCTLTLHFRSMEPRVNRVQKQMRLRLVYRIIIGGNVSSYVSIIVFVSINILYRSLDLDLGQFCCQGCILLHIYSHHRNTTKYEQDCVKNELRYCL
jgi:hypothetical protein